MENLSFAVTITAFPVFSINNSATVNYFRVTLAELDCNA